MRLNKKSLSRYFGILILSLGTANARTYKLKKIIVINESGNGAAPHTDQINFTSNYFCTTLAPKYAFTCTIPKTQAAIDSVFRDDSLRTYDVVVFNGGARIGGTDAVGDTGAKNAFQRWLKHGGGLVGIHSLMDHANTWPWLRDTVFNGTIFTVHSNWGSDPNAKVQWDTLKTNGVLNSMKPEYDSIRACFPPLHNNFIYPDEWETESINPRPFADVLLTVDEATYTVPTNGTMGLGHPVAWAYHLPPDSAGNIGRFIYNERGHEVGAWDGTSTNHAPISPAPIDGIAYSDTSHSLMTKGFLWQSLRWAAGLTQTPTTSISMKTSEPELLNIHSENGSLKIAISGMKRTVVVDLFDLSGHKLSHQSGEGNREYSFTNLQHSNVYVIRVKSGNQSYSRRVLF